MILSRRGFLKLSIGVAIGAMTAILAARHAQAWLLAPFRALYARLLSPGLEDTPTGPLSEAVLNTLLAATRALAGVPVQIAHYEDFFRWRAENLRGYTTLYEQFAAALNRRARRLHGCDFIHCSQQMQQQILVTLPQVRSADTRWHGMRVAVLEREWVRFDQYIVQSILLLLYRTDAWPLLGYEAWPGTPRGLERYTQAPHRVPEVPVAR
jgi:hypothetical protein